MWIFLIRARMQAMSHASVWLKRLPCFDQRFETGEDARPAIGAEGVGRIVFRPFVMRDGDPGGLGLRYEFYRDAGDIAGRAEGECVPQQLWRFRLEHLT